MNVTGLVHHLGQFIAPLSSVSDICRKHSQYYLHGIAQGLPWALRMADATAKAEPGLLQGNVHSLGYFEECIDVKPNADFSAHHCTATLNLEEEPVKTPMEEMLKIKGMLWGICLPSTCSSSDVRSSLNEWLADWKMQASHVDCDASLYRPMDVIDWLALSILIALGLLVLLSTAYDTYWVYKRRHYPSRWRRYSYYHKDDLFTSFSVLNNSYFLCKEVRSADISSLYGIRFLSMCWVVLGHVFLTVENIPSINYPHVRELLGSWTIMPIVSAPLAVDTFLMMSGLLLTHKFLKIIPRNTSCNKLGASTLLIIVHRYLRIAPALAMLILLQVSLWRHAGSGPLWIGGNTYLVEFCKQNWFWALLFVQNYVTGDRMCLGHSWYLSVDMQLFLLSPLVVIPLLYWRKWICLLLLTCLVISGFASSFLVNYFYQLPAGLLVGDQEKWAAKSQYYYIVAHTRYAAYIIGIGVGYLLHKYKDQLLINPFTWKTKVPFWIATAVALPYSIFGVLPFQAPGYKYEPITSSAFTAAAPIIWSMAVGWIVFSCETKQCPLLSHFLGKRMFQPLARLTYSIYLVHLPIMTMRANIRRAPVFLSANAVVNEFLGCYVLSVICGIFLYLGVEGPFTKFGYIISRKLNERWAIAEERQRNSTSIEMTPSPPRVQNISQDAGEEVAVLMEQEPSQSS